MISAVGQNILHLPSFITDKISLFALLLYSYTASERINKIGKKSKIDTIFGLKGLDCVYLRRRWRIQQCWFDGDSKIAMQDNLFAPLDNI